MDSHAAGSLTKREAMSALKHVQTRRNVRYAPQSGNLTQPDFPIAHLPNRDVRRDLLLLDQPAQELASAIRRVGREPLRLQIEAPLGAIQHRFSGNNFIVSASRCRFDIDNHCILNINEVVQTIAELHPLIGLGGPCRLRVRRRDHLGWLALVSAWPAALWVAAGFII